MEVYFLFVPVLFIALASVYRGWERFCSFLKVENERKKTIMLVAFTVIIFFSVGFGMRLSGEKAVIDTGYFLTDLAFLLSYLLIGFAALFGQAKYHCG